MNSSVFECDGYRDGAAGLEPSPPGGPVVLDAEYMIGHKKGLDSRKWYALTESGDIKCLGECADFDEADELAPDGTVWIADRSTVEGWFEQLRGLMK